MENNEQLYGELYKKFPEQCVFADKISLCLREGFHCIVQAPVKSGKRLMAEAMALANTRCPACQRRWGIKPEKHLFLTSLLRKDIETQHRELEDYGLMVLKLGSVKAVIKAVEVLRTLAKEYQLIIHFDESDYGTAAEQLFSNIWSVGLEEGAKFICYSATNEEAIFSGFADKCKTLTFIPHPNYRGAEFFLANNLVHRSTRFVCGGRLTDQGLEAMELFQGSGKALAVVRIVDGSFRELKSGKLSNIFRDELLKYRAEPLFVDGQSKFEWETQYQPLVNVFDKVDLRRLIVINQTCTRSTEVGFHKHIAFWHDHRGLRAAYNTCHQAFLRIAHYRILGEPENKIRIYAVPEVFELAADKMTKEEFTAATDRGLSGRIEGEKLPKLRYKVRVFRDRGEAMGALSAFVGTGRGIASTCGQKGTSNMSTWFRRLKEYEEVGEITHKKVKDAGYAICIDGSHPEATDGGEMYREFTGKWPYYEGKILVMVPIGEADREPIMTGADSIFQG